MRSGDVMRMLEMRRLGWVLTCLVAVAGLGAYGWGLGCDGSGVNVCGNGRVERGEQCDCGTDLQNLPAGCNQVNGGPNSGCSSQCMLRQVLTNQVRIRWTINGESILGAGSFDTCNDVDVTFVKVHVEGASGYLADRTRVSCGDYVTAFTDDPANAPLVAGAYSVTLELQSSDEVAMAPSRDATFVLAPGMDNEVWVDFPLESFYDYASMRGTLLYRLYWGMEGGLCGDATEPVATQSVLLSQQGVPVAGFPAEGPCLDSTQTVPDLTPGDYEIHAEGFGAQGHRTYCYAGDVKVGAGVQPGYVIVVPSVDASACQD